MLTCLFAFALALQAASAPTSQPAVIWSDDFDGNGPALQRWDLAGRMQGKPLPVEATPIPGVAGKAFVINAGDEGRMVRAESLPPLDLSQATELVLRIDALSATERNPVVLEALFLTRDRVAWRGKRIRIDQPGWREIRVPLRHALPTGDASIDWEDIDNFGLRFRREATISIDGIELLGGSNGPVFSTDELAALAFGDRPVRRWEAEPVTVVTDAPALSREGTMAALEALRQRIRSDFERRGFGKTPAHLLVFADEQAYRDFWPKLGALLDRPISAPTSDGYSAFGIATTFCQGADECSMRPVLIHEAAHAMLAKALGLDGGNWLIEGLATRYQLAHSGQDIAPSIRLGLDEVGRRLPLLDLLGAEKIEPDRYWQAYTMAEFMLAEENRAKFNAALVEMRKYGSADIRNLLPRMWGMRAKPFEKRWLEWSQQRWP